LTSSEGEGTGAEKLAAAAATYKIFINIKQETKKLKVCDYT
jgi:hypothetical protein